MPHQPHPYFLTCLSRAKTDTGRFLDLRTRSAWLKLVTVALVGFLFQLLAFPRPRSAAEWAIRLFGVGGLTIALFPVVFLVQLLFLVPRRLYAEHTLKIYDLQREISALREAQFARLQIVFEERNSFVQRTANECLYRVGVHNLSATQTLESVEVDLVDLQPLKPPFLPLRLHQMHDNPPLDGVFAQTFDLAPGGTKYIDVLTVVVTPRGRLLWVHHIVPGLRKDFAQTITRLDIRASARNSPSALSRFVLTEVSGSMVLSAV